MLNRRVSEIEEETPDRVRKLEGENKSLKEELREVKRKLRQVRNPREEREGDCETGRREPEQAARVSTAVPCDMRAADAEGARNQPPRYVTRRRATSFVANEQIQKSAAGRSDEVSGSEEVRGGQGRRDLISRQTAWQP